MAQKQYLVIGAGKMGEAIAYDLGRTAGPGAVTMIDADGSRVAALAKKLGCNGLHCPLSHENEVAGLMRAADVAVSAVPYDHNFALAMMAIETRTHFCDLGGNNVVVQNELSLDRRARTAGVNIVPDCGIAPGAVSIMARYAIDKLGRDPEYVRIRVGGIPAEPEGSFGYEKAFSVHGLVNEYIEPVEVLKDGEFKREAPLGGHEILTFDGLGPLEAAYTSGGSSTLAMTYAGTVKELNYKTLRYPGHWPAVRAMYELGFFRDDKVTLPDGRSVAARTFTERMLERGLKQGRDDLMVFRITVGDRETEVVLEGIDRADPKTGHTAMQRTTGYSAAIIAKMLGDGLLGGGGTHCQELGIPAATFLDEWSMRGMPIKMSLTNKAAPGLSTA